MLETGLDILSLFVFVDHVDRRVLGGVDGVLFLFEDVALLSLVLFGGLLCCGREVNVAALFFSHVLGFL